MDLNGGKEYNKEEKTTHYKDNKGKEWWQNYDEKRNVTATYTENPNL